METLIAKLSVAASRWQPEEAPFDAAVASTLRVVVLGMGEAENKAGTAGVKSVIHENTAAFGALAKAMAGDKPEKVQDAIGGTKVAYKDLKAACGLS
jgi:hypothetical protein